MEFLSRAFLVFLMKESKKRRRKQPDKSKSRSQPVNLPGARPLMNPLKMGFTDYLRRLKRVFSCTGARNLHMP